MESYICIFNVERVYASIRGFKLVYSQKLCLNLWYSMFSILPHFVIILWRLLFSIYLICWSEFACHILFESNQEKRCHQRLLYTEFNQTAETLEPKINMNLAI